MAEVEAQQYEHVANPVVADIFAHILERQVPQQAQMNALFSTAVGAARFPFGSKRATYIGWIFQLSGRLGFGPDTGASAVLLMDRTLLLLGRACPRLPEDGIELMCVGCLWIAAKMEEKEVDIPTLTYLIEVTGITRADSAVSHELRSMETIILQAAEWNASVISPTHFVPHYTGLLGELFFGPFNGPNKEEYKTATLAAGDFAFQLIRLALVGSPLRCLPSMMGVTATIMGFEMARLPVWEQWTSIRATTGIDTDAAEEAFSECYQEMGRMAHRLIKVHRGVNAPTTPNFPFEAAAKAGVPGLPGSSKENTDPRSPPKAQIAGGGSKAKGGGLKEIQTPTAGQKRSHMLPLSPDSPGSPMGNDFSMLSLEDEDHLRIITV